MGINRMVMMMTNHFCFIRAGFIAFQEASNLLMDIMFEYSFMRASTLFYQIIVNYYYIALCYCFDQRERTSL